MSWTVNSCFVTLAILFLWRVEEVAEACSCSPSHPQQAVCNADVVIRAKVTGKQEDDVGNDIYGNSIKQIKYDIEQIKMFKGSTQDIDAIYTAPSPSVCGVTLETNSTEYLITGKLKTDGKVHITLCHLIQPWDALSTTQKNSLTQRYEMGCDCKIIRCTSIPCTIRGPQECLWTDWVLERTVNGAHARNFACIKRSDNSCAWYRGAELPKKDFLDIEDP
ncbi:metalloproteinase inhibitor 2b [Plectropomus leopardus]|uniref:metalloproteinase inhibitor 2b n=1 Tax=Plectropomus leopardus TaxID=160734 RepID=UPI001C4B5704|nr:metalloproteinase inhibitor 2b [Plectropomus leopardus]